MVTLRALSLLHHALTQLERRVKSNGWFSMTVGKQVQVATGSQVHVYLATGLTGFLYFPCTT